MYIFKNALRSISRSKGRNILIGIIALVIAVSACVALSIRQSAIKARENTLSEMGVTAQISVDRSAMMGNAKGEDGKIDRDSMVNMMQDGGSLSLEELQTYAKAESVKSFYYSLSASLDVGDGVEPVDTMGAFSRDDTSSSDASGSTTQSKSGG